jgi:predicted DNA-binding transcriptional regulator AlpA
MQVVEKFKLEAPNVLPAGFVTLSEACEILGRSDSTIERYVAQKKLEQRIIRQPGSRRTVRTYPKAALIELRKAEERKKDVRPPSAVAPKPPAVALALAAPVAATSQALEKVAAGIVGFTSAFDSFTQRKPSVPITEKLWLSLEEAEELSGLARATLLKLAQSGAVAALKSGGWRLQRKSLEAFNGMPHHEGEEDN